LFVKKGQATQKGLFLTENKNPIFKKSILLPPVPAGLFLFTDNRQLSHCINIVDILFYLPKDF